MPTSGLKIGRLHIRVPMSVYGLGALLIIAAGVGIRLALIAQGWPGTNSDEGTYGMMAINIAYHGAHPIFMYGQNYMGATQAYLAALFFHLFGISLFSLRLGLVILFAAFLIAMYWLTSLLYSRGMALVTLLILIFGSSYVFYRQLQAVGGWVETLFFGAFLYFLASWLALTAGQNEDTVRRRLRLAAYFGWGLLVGLCIWSDVVIAPYILTSGILLLLFCRREIRSWAPAWLVAGLLVGCLPLILYNIHITILTNSLSTSLGIFARGATGHSRLYYLVHGTLGVLLIGLPAILGNGNVCNAPNVLFFGGSGTGAIECTLSQSLWSLVWIALCVSSVYLSIKTIKALPRDMEKRDPAQQQELVRSYARLGLLAAAAIALILFVVSSSSTLFPLLSSRYILFIWIATPALVYPLWLGASAARKPANLFTRLITVDSKCLLLAVIILLLAWSTVNTFQLIPSTQATEAQQEDLIHNLVRIGAVHIYSDYWTCERLMFQSQGQIICDTVGADLSAGFVRYPPDRVTVQSDPKASYVFQLNLPQAIAQRAAQSPGQYRRYVFDGYVVYQPV